MIKKSILLNIVLILTLLPAGLQAKPFSTIYVIGDSLSDQGNLYQATQLLTGTGIPASDFYYLGRFSNGENYAGLLAERIGMSVAATALGGSNFAYGGTRTAYNIVEDPPTPGGAAPGLFPWTLNLQRMAFAGQLIHDPQALYIVFSGANDLADLIPKTLALGFAATGPDSDKVVDGVRKVIVAYRAAGARDILVPNLPDLGLVPQVFRRDPLPGQPPDSRLVAATATALAIRYNQALDAMLKEFTDVNIIRFDTFSFLRKVVASPAAFGLTNATDPCYTGFVVPAGPGDTVCATPQTYLFWDREHPTTALHGLLAERMHSTLVVDLLEDLRAELARLNLNRGVRTALLTMLDSASRSLLDSKGANDVVAGKLLGAFIATVDSLPAEMIPADKAAALIQRARQIAELQAAEMNVRR